MFSRSPAVCFPSKNVLQEVESLTALEICGQNTTHSGMVRFSWTLTHHPQTHSLSKPSFRISTLCESGAGSRHGALWGLRADSAWALCSPCVNSQANTHDEQQETVLEQ